MFYITEKRLSKISYCESFAEHLYRLQGVSAKSENPHFSREYSHKHFKLNQSDLCLWLHFIFSSSQFFIFSLRIWHCICQRLCDRCDRSQLLVQIEPNFIFIFLCLNFWDDTSTKYVEEWALAFKENSSTIKWVYYFTNTKYPFNIENFFSSINQY